MEIVLATWNPRKAQWINEGLLKIPIQCGRYLKMKCTKLMIVEIPSRKTRF